MAEFLGSRISLVSKSDIRYVGTLHEIDSDQATVALENVTSFGTENRKDNPDDYIPPSDSVYEYIVFRGSDVKDLRIEQSPAVKENKPPALNDPAILGSGSRPTPPSQPQAQAQAPAPQPQRQSSQGPPQQTQGPPQGPPQGVPPQFAQHPQYPAFYPPPTGWGRAGPPPPGPGGFPPMPYGAPPPGWYPGPPGPQGFPPGPFPPYGYPPGPPGQFQPPPQNQGPKPGPIGPGANKQQSPPASNSAEKQAEPKSLAKPAAEMAAAAVQKAPSPPTATKPSPNEVQAAIDHPSTAQTAASKAAAKATPSGPKNNRVTPALPLQSPAAPKAPLQQLNNNAQAPATKAVDPSAALRDATQAATAAVAAAMAKLPGQMNGNGTENLTKKVNDMRMNDPIRAPRHPGAAGAGFAANRGRGGGRGGARNVEKKVEVPESDFDFETANAKFNKQDLVKEAIAGSPLGENPPVASPSEAEVPVGGYNKSTSFFDNISSESKDRMEATGQKAGGREWRGEEQKKNVETFGQGSVDNGYRGGYRGRGRGRGGFRGGRGYSGNGQPGRGRGGYRGRGDAQAAV
ncbi:Scd6-like Sm domain-containing protein [Rhexocercosporidium sp. MPI-PUGE-AT-0058]|nr:Scd6-like Sm domain-containing protein [Rhexocercosporidium sp. MPI-PUGE-AT-0058]